MILNLRKNNMQPKLNSILTVFKRFKEFKNFWKNIEKNEIESTVYTVKNPVR